MITTEIAGDAKSVIEMLSLLDSTYQIDCKQTCHGSTHILTCKWFSDYMAIRVSLNDQMKIIKLDHINKGSRALNHNMMQINHISNDGDTSLFDYIENQLPTDPKLLENLAESGYFYTPYVPLQVSKIDIKNK